MSTATITPLAELADAVVKATRLKGLTVKLTPVGREARLLLDGRTLAYLHGTKKGIRVHVQHYGREERTTFATVKDAAAAVKRSERRAAPPTTAIN